ncbi:MAG: hypothetical protein JST38_20735 [Bacteroidetes bacterium]|nr:hypothetical protein [Bacteroidota bacterium]
MKSNTVREAIAAELLGEIDGLVLRLENTARTVQEHEASAKASTDALLSAADQFKLAVTQFSESATAQVREAVERHAHEVITQTRDEAAAAMQEAARQAWRTSALDEADRLGQRLRALAREFHPVPAWQRLVEAAAGGLIGAALVFVLLLALGKL